MTRRAIAQRLLLAAAALLAVPAAFAAAPVRQSLDLDRVPDWVREVAARPVPQTDADAVVLLEEDVVEPLADGSVKTTHRFAVKILRVSASDDFSAQIAVYRKGDPRPEMETWVLYGDGKAVIPDQVEDRADMPYVERGFDYADSRLARLATPAPNPGSVVVFERSVVDSIDVGAHRVLLGDTARPTLLSRVDLRLPAGWSGDASVARGKSVDVRKTASSIVVEAKDIPAQPRRSDLALNANRVLPSVWVRWWNPTAKRGFADWNAVGKWYEDLAAPRVADAGGAQAAGAALKPANDAAFLGSLEKAFAVAARDVRYAAIEMGIGGYQPAAASATFRDKFGDCKAKATLLRALLKTWGADVYPVLVRTRELGPIADDAPTPGAFNHYIAAVRLPAGVGADLWAARDVEGVGRLLFVDATQPESVYELPSGDQGTRAALLLPNGTRLVDLPVRPAATHVTTTTITGTLERDGRLSALKIDLAADRGAAARERGALRPLSADERLRFLLLDLRRRFGALRLQRDEVRGLEDLGQPFGRTIDAADAVAGQRIRRVLLLETGRLAPPVPYGLLSAEPPDWSLDVGEPRREIVEMSIKIPAGVKLDEAPAPIKYEDDVVAIDAGFALDGDTLRYHRTLELRAPYVAPAKFASFRERMSALRRLETDGVALFD